MAGGQRGHDLPERVGRDLRAGHGTGWMMAQVGPGGFFLFIGLLFVALARLCRLADDAPRSAPAVQAASRRVSPSASALAVEAVRGPAAEPRT